MLKILTSRLDGRSTFAKRIFCPNPKTLGKLTDEYPQASTTRQAAIIKQFSALVSGFWIGGSVKQTGRNRLSRVDQLILDCLNKSHTNVSLLDVGASDTVTTLDSVEAFSSAKKQLSATAIDRFAYLERHRLLLWSEYRTSDGTPIIATILGLGMLLAKREKKLKRVSKLLKGVYFAAFPRSLLKPAGRCKLQNPAAVSADIVLLEQDAFVDTPKWHQQYDLVRVSNFLQPVAFTPEQIREAILLFSKYVKIGGLLVCSRSPAPREKPGEMISICRKLGEDQFEIIAEENEGTEAVQALLASTQSLTN